MAAYIPGAGRKKPLNQIEGPIYPDIRQAPPRFVWSRKHWKVDVGKTMLDTEPHTQFYENAILAQSRDYNKTVYGQSSHKDIVNAEFRPPLISEYEDNGPLNRLPTKIYSIVPRINPGTAGHDAGTSGYEARNQKVNGIESALTDRISTGRYHAMFYRPVHIPLNNPVLPDLELKLPSVSAHSGVNVPIRVTGPPVIEEFDPRELRDDTEFIQGIDSGFSTQLRVDGPSGYEDLELFNNRPTYSVSAGMNPGITINGETQLDDLELFNNRPTYSVSAGMNPGITIDGETRLADLELFNNRPTYSVSAGMNPGITIDGETQLDDLFLETKLGGIDVGVVNPEYRFRTRQDAYADPAEYIKRSKPSYSATSGVNNPFGSRNGESYKPFVRKKITPLKTYGKISHASAIPRPGINVPSSFSKSNSLTGRIRYAGARSKNVKYRF